MPILRLKRWLFGSRRRVAATTVLLLAGVLVVFVRSRSETPPSLVVYPTPFTIPTVSGPIPDRWIPQGQTWGWLWHLRYALLPRIKDIVLETTLWRVSGSFAIRPGELKPELSEKGLSVWILSESDLGLLQARMESATGVSIVSRPRVGTAEAIGSSVRIGDPSATGGVSVELLPRLNGRMVDLLATALVTTPGAGASGSSVRTNLDIAFRVQIPPLGGVFVVSDHDRERMAVLLTATVQKPK
jgi:hypothetical protein